MKKIVLVLVFALFTNYFLNAQVNATEAKAKFIYNFTKFFEWPTNERNGDFVIGVLGSPNMYNELKSYMEGKKVAFQNITVKRFRSSAEVTDCHVLFVSEFKGDQIEGIHKNTGHYTLIISDFYQGIEQGSAINFKVENDRLKYEFCSANSLKYGLKYSSKIKELAVKNYN